jgi:deoxyuridine 5'-triphosphate nucleotidohydrolase
MEFSIALSELETYSGLSDIPHRILDDCAWFDGCNAVDAIAIRYGQEYPTPHDGWNQLLKSNTFFHLAHPDAQLPAKSKASDVGYDLTIISEVKQISAHAVLYDTGVSVQPPDGYYFEVVPRSSFSKSGLLFANNIGIIDPSYRGTIKIALVRMSEHTTVKLPFTGFQLVLRQQHHTRFEEKEHLAPTERDSKGFGSTSASVPFQQESEPNETSELRERVRLLKDQLSRLETLVWDLRLQVETASPSIVVQYNENGPEEE